MFATRFDQGEAARVPFRGWKHRYPSFVPPRQNSTDVRHSRTNRRGKDSSTIRFLPSPLLVSLVLSISARSQTRILKRVPVLKLGNFFFRFFANLIFLRNLIISKHENLDIWNGRLRKFWKMNGGLCIWNMNWNFVLLSWAQFEKCITLFSRVQYAIEVSKTWICKKLRII